MKRTRLPGVRSNRKAKVTPPPPTEATVALPSPSSSELSQNHLPSAAEPISISAMLQVASTEPTITMHYPVPLTLTAPTDEFDFMAYADRASALIDAAQAWLTTIFTRPVRRRQAIRRKALAGPVPRQARRANEHAWLWSLRRLLDRFSNASTPWRYVPWALSVVVASYFIWRGPTDTVATSAARQHLAVAPGTPNRSSDLNEVGVATAGENWPTDEGEDIQGTTALVQTLSKEAADVAQLSGSDPFGVPNGLRAAVAFWQRVFGIWGAGEVVLHDSEHLGIVYRVVQLPEGAGGARLTAVDQRTVDQQKHQLCATLNDLEYRLKRRQGLTQEQTRLLRLLTLLGGKGAINGAADRVRIQRGMRNSFQQGLAVSGRYEKAFRQVFRDSGLPEDLVYLAHVESAFTSKARSPAGAVGVWQFMPETGRRFLRIDRSLDERYDPVLSTRGAARYFHLAQDKLGDWGLAITSFNHGLTGMLNAKAECGTSIECVVNRYDAPTFGFASRNYYAEFLAIRSIVKNLNRYFPDGVNFAAPLERKRIRLARAVPVQEIARAHGLGLQDLIEINPAWTSAAAQGRVALPVDVDIWVPEDAVVKDASLSGLIARIEDDTAPLSR